MSLFARKKRIQVQKKPPDAYFKHYYISKNNKNGIVLMSKALHFSRTRVVNEMLEYATRHIIGELLGNRILVSLRRCSVRCSEKYNP
jgi:hypothetical protein